MRKGFFRTLAFTLAAASIMASAIPACAMSESTGSAVESSVSVDAEQANTDNNSETDTELSRIEKTIEELMAKLTEAYENNASDAEIEELSNKLIEAEEARLDIINKEKDAKEKAKEKAKAKEEEEKAAEAAARALEDAKAKAKGTKAEAAAKAEIAKAKAAYEVAAKTGLEKAIKNLDPSDIRTFPTGHYMVNGVQVYCDAYCIALLYYDAPENAVAYCSGTIIIKDTSVWDKGPLTQIAGTPLKNIIKPCGVYHRNVTFGEISKIKLNHIPSGVYKHLLCVTGGAAESYDNYHTTSFNMSFMDKTGDIYNLGFSSKGLGTDTSRVHDLNYNSDAPDIVRIDWNGSVLDDLCKPGGQARTVCTYAY